MHSMPLLLDLPLYVILLAIAERYRGLIIQFATNVINKLSDHKYVPAT